MVCFAVEDEQGSGQEAANDEDNPHVPTPASTLCNEATADGTEDRTEKNAHTVDGYSLATLRRDKHVGNDTSADCQTRAASDTSEESHADEATKVRRKRAADSEGAEEDIGAVEYDASSVDL